MKLSLLLRTAVHRGDHDADVTIAFEAKPGETIEELVRRVISLDRRDRPLPSDVIEVRVVQEPRL